MKNSYKILTALILFFICAFSVSSAPQQLQMQSNSSDKDTGVVNLSTTPLLKGGVQCVQELPQGMYGMWQVRGTLVETDNGNKYVSNSSDIWILRKDGDFVTLINPQNGARATITVTEVQNNTATFVRTVRTGVSTDTEQVTITLQGDSFIGTDFILSKYNATGSNITSMAKYRLHGDKIMGQTIYQRKQVINF